MSHNITITMTEDEYRKHYKGQLPGMPEPELFWDDETARWRLSESKLEGLRQHHDAERRHIEEIVRRASDPMPPHSLLGSIG